MVFKNGEFKKNIKNSKKKFKGCRIFEKIFFKRFLRWQLFIKPHERIKPWDIQKLNKITWQLFIRTHKRIKPCNIQK